MRVFVFGSNLAGRHGKGAALYAKERHGARFEVGVSLSSTYVRMVPKAPKDKVIKLGPVELTLR